MSIPAPIERSEASPFHLRHVPALDGLRGLAIVMVVGYHLHGRLLKGGHVGVDLFFVLSGFLITALLLQEWEERGAISFPRFYARRALRLLPALYLVLAVYLLALRIPGLDRVLRERAGADPWHPAVYAATYISNWTRGRGVSMGALAHTWSLSVEEQFYLLWPLLLALALRARWPYRRLMIGIALAAAASAVHRALLWHYRDDPLDVFRIYDGIDTRADALLIGCLTALLLASGAHHSVPARLLNRTNRAGLLLLAVTAQCVRFSSSGMFYGGMTLVAAASGVLILSLSTQPYGRLQALLQSAPLIWLGRRSYGLYLWHYPLFMLTPSWPAVCRILLALAAAALSFAVIEKPALRLKEQFASGAGRRLTDEAGRALPAR
jgi:peptidoglycan/LPS O-acetylase OafA/YrhL